jgi:hypothetical protein
MGRCRRRAADSYHGPGRHPAQWLVGGSGPHAQAAEQLRAQCRRPPVGCQGTDARMCTYEVFYLYR